MKKKGYRGYWIVGIALLAIWGAGLAGCGKKEDPMPPDVKLPEAVQQLTARKVGTFIRLSWEMPGGDASLKDIRIRRSELETLRSDCPECPRNYKEIAVFLTDDPLILTDKKGVCRYDDTQVKDGWLYTYRVVVCNQKGFCSEPSEPAELKF